MVRFFPIKKEDFDNLFPDHQTSPSSSSSSSFTNGTDEEVINILTAIKNGTETLSSVGWKIGDKRTINLNRTFYKLRSSQDTIVANQTANLIIADDKYELLYNPYNANIKLVLTFEDCINFEQGGDLWFRDTQNSLNIFYDTLIAIKNSMDTNLTSLFSNTHYHLEADFGSGAASNYKLANNYVRSFGINIPNDSDIDDIAYYKNASHRKKSSEWGLSSVKAPTSSSGAIVIGGSKNSTISSPTEYGGSVAVNVSQRTYGCININGEKQYQSDYSSYGICPIMFI